MNELQHRIERFFPAIIGIIYFIFRPVTAGSSHDALDYVLNVMGYNDDNWFNPHHLVFEGMHKSILSLLGVFGLNLEPMFVMQVVTIAFSMASIYITILILRQLNIDIMLRLYCVAILASTYGYWHYSSVADTYIPALTFNLLATYFFVKANLTEIDYKHVALIGVAVSIAILFQQNYVFLIPVFSIALFLIWFSKREVLPVQVWVKQNVVMGAVCALIVGSAYLGVSFFILEHQNIGESIEWARGYSNDGLWTEFSLIGSPVKMAMGLAQAIWGLDFILANSYIASHLPIDVTAEELFLVTGEFSGLQATLLMLATVIGAAAFLWLLFQIIMHVVKAPRQTGTDIGPDSAYAAYFLPFMAIFGVATLVWEPVNLEFHLHFLPAIFIFAVLKIKALKTNRLVQPAMMIFLVSLLGISFFGGVKAHISDETDYWNYANSDIVQAVTEDDLIILDCNYGCYLNMRYETKAGTTHQPVENSPTIHLLAYSDEDAIETAKQYAEDHSTGRVFLSQNIFKNPNFEGIDETEIYSDKLDKWYEASKPYLHGLESSELERGFERHKFFEYIPVDPAT